MSDVASRNKTLTDQSGRDMSIVFSAIRLVINGSKTCIVARKFVHTCGNLNSGKIRRVRKLKTTQRKAIPNGKMSHSSGPLKFTTWRRNVLENKRTACARRHHMDWLSQAKQQQIVSGIQALTIQTKLCDNFRKNDFGENSATFGNVLRTSGNNVI